MRLATAALWLRERGLSLDVFQLKHCAKEIAEARDKTFKGKQGLPRENLLHYYQLLQQIVNDYHIDVSTSIGNLDESFVHFDLKSRKVIAERNAKTVYQLSCLTGEQLKHITVVSFVSSDGHSFPT